MLCDLCVWHTGFLICSSSLMDNKDTEMEENFLFVDNFLAFSQPTWSWRKGQYFLLMGLRVPAFFLSLSLSLSLSLDVLCCLKRGRWSSISIWTRLAKLLYKLFAHQKKREKVGEGGSKSSQPSFLFICCWGARAIQQVSLSFLLSFFVAKFFLFLLQIFLR